MGLVMTMLNKRSKSALKKSGVLLTILIMAIYTWTVYRYGNFNIFGSPHRVISNGFRFDDYGVVTLTGDDQPKYEISSIVDKLTGKKIYSIQRSFKADFGTRVFLHIKDDDYILLQCGGGM
jgi:hypothetical protein